MDQHGQRHDPHLDRRTIEGIESCRPSSDDLRGQDLADVAERIAHDEPARHAYERAQRWDATIVGAMEDVIVPAGLAERIVERLRAAGAISDDLTTQALAPTAVTIEGRRISRRYFAAGSCLAVAAAVLVAFFFSDLLRPRSDVPWEVMADRWQDSLSPRVDAWRDAERLPRGFAVPAGVLGTLDSWQPLNAAPGVALRLVRGDGTVAMLYAVRGPSTTLPAGPPARPQSTTGGKAVGYWHSGGVIYVLVVPGDERLYRQFVSPSATPLA